MSKHPRIGFAVADGARALIVATEDGRNFRVVATLESATAHARTHDLVSDRPGRSMESSGGAHHAIEAKHDPHELEKDAFLRSVAERLNRDPDGFDRLVLIAPKRQLGQLRGHLTDALRGKVTVELAKDLVKLPSEQLYARLADLLRLH